MATGLENLNIYKLSEELEIMVHQLTKSFPKDEKYRSVDQLRRSSSSVSNNIAEGYGRPSIVEKIRYIHIAKGEAEETKSNLERCIKKEICNPSNMANKYDELTRQMVGYIKFLKNSQLKTKD